MVGLLRRHGTETAWDRPTTNTWYLLRTWTFAVTWGRAEPKPYQITQPWPNPKPQSAFVSGCWWTPVTQGRPAQPGCAGYAQVPALVELGASSQLATVNSLFY